MPEYGEPKTTRSRRSVRLAPEAMDAVKSHQVRQAEPRRVLDSESAHFDLGVATQTGTPLLARNVLHAFKSALAKAGLPHTIRVHDLRHASATVALAAGLHPKVMAERLAHSTIVITLGLYTHAVEGLDANAAARMERAIRGATKVQELRYIALGYQHQK